MKSEPKILIGYDGSECAVAALDDLSRTGLPSVASARILSVAESWLPPPAPSSYEIVENASSAESPAELQKRFAKNSVAARAALALAEEAREKMLASFPSWQVSVESDVGSPGRVLLETAELWKPDLIVVGSHGRSALGRFVLGSVSQRVTSDASGSVRVARGRVQDPEKPVKIVVGIDGGGPSMNAVREVASRCWPKGSEVNLILVNDPLIPEYLRYLIPPLDRVVKDDECQEAEWVRKITSEPLALMRDKGIQVSVVIKEGDPKKEIPSFAEASGADCIFVGSGEFSNRLERFILGSVSAAIAARAHCSVEVVRSERNAPGKGTGNDLDAQKRRSDQGMVPLSK